MSGLLKFEDLRNESKSTFEDISSEEARTYYFPGGDVITIASPIALSVAKSGGHRLLDGYGSSHYIPRGWIHIKWTVKEDAPHFVK